MAVAGVRGRRVGVAEGAVAEREDMRVQRRFIGGWEDLVEEESVWWGVMWRRWRRVEESHC